MRLKTFTAPSMPEAMRLVRDQLGPDAIIVSSQPADKGKGVIVTAAIEQAPEPVAAALAEWCGSVFIKGSRRYQLEKVLASQPAHSLPC